MPLVFIRKPKFFKVFVSREIIIDSNNNELFSIEIEKFLLMEMRDPFPLKNVIILVNLFNNEKRKKPNSC